MKKSKKKKTSDRENNHLFFVTIDISFKQTILQKNFVKKTPFFPKKPGELFVSKLFEKTLKRKTFEKKRNF